MTIQMEYWRTGAVEDVDAFFDDSAASYLFIPYELARGLGVLWIRWMTIHVNQLKSAFEDDLDLPGRYVGVETQTVLGRDLTEEQLDDLGLVEVFEPLDETGPSWFRSADGTDIVEFTDEVLVAKPGGRELDGYCMHRTLMQSMPREWQHEVIALARYAFSRPGADQYHPYKIVPQRRVRGEWVTVEDPVPGHGFGLTRLAPRLESP
jgi:hypothetical protein